jgi:transcriptional regulator with XRE-family HTH domain
MAGMSADLVRFGLTVRDVRRAAGITQQELGDKLGISNVAISQIENAKAAPALARAIEIADTLGVSLAVLFGDPLAVAEYTVREVRRQVRALGYDLALIPRDDT